MLKRFILSALLILIPALPSSAAVTEADVKYSQDIGALTQDFSKAINEWSTSLANQPKFAVGAKYNTWKKGALSTTAKTQATIKKLAGVKPTPAFTKSDALLKKACQQYLSAMTTFTQGINKNDAKLLNKAMDAFVAANKSYADWGPAFNADMKAINS